MKFSRIATFFHLPLQSVLTAPGTGNSIAIARQAPDNAGVVAKDLVSFSIEFRHLPKFTGSQAEPNDFSQNLLDNLKDFTGVYPLIRVGGGSQDFTIYNATQEEPEVDVPGVPDGQAGNGPTASISARYFESFQVWSQMDFIVGLNLAFFNDDGVDSLRKIVKYACGALSDRLVLWEVGNEADLLPNWGQRNGDTWDIPTYVSQWKEFSSMVVDQTKDSCSGMVRGFYGPSIGSVSTDTGSFTNAAAFAAGINDQAKTPIKQIATHSYMGIGGNAHLQSTLMNHDKVKSTIQKYLNLQQDLSEYGDMPFTIGEGNSLTGGGQFNVSDVFGAGLWAADYSLYIASWSSQITRMHFHQSYSSKNGSPYNAWKPVGDDLGPPETRPSYYGKLLAAKMIGSESNVQINEVPLPDTDGFESMYVAYDGDTPVRVTILNLRQWDDGNRHTRRYTINLPSGSSWTAKAERLQGPGATAKTGITFGGYSYDYHTSRGKPMLVSEAARTNSSSGVSIDGDRLVIEVPDSEGVLVTLDESGAASSSDSSSSTNEAAASNSESSSASASESISTPSSESSPTSTPNSNTASASTTSAPESSPASSADSSTTPSATSSADSSSESSTPGGQILGGGFDWSSIWQDKKRELYTHAQDRYRCLPVHAPRQDDIPHGWMDCSRA